MPRIRLSGLEIVLPGVKEEKPEVVLDKNHNFDNLKCSNQDEDAHKCETEESEIFLVNKQVELLAPCSSVAPQGTVIAFNKKLKIRSVGNYVCDICGTTFSRKWHLHRHVEKVHRHCLDMESYFECTECDYKARNLNSIHRHFGNNHGEKSIKCDLCDSSFGNEKGLNKHKELKHISEYLCDECSYNGPSMRSLKRHKKKHEGLMFSCSECKFTCNTHEKHYAHIRRCAVPDTGLVRCVLPKPRTICWRQTSTVKNAKTDYLHGQMINEVKQSLSSDTELDYSLDHIVKIEDYWEVKDHQ